MTIDFMKIGERVRENRRAKGQTQAQLAEAVELSTEYICEIETGRKKVSLSALSRISEELEVTIDELLSGGCSEDTSIRAMAVVMRDCTEYERKVLCDNMKSLKLILRDNSIQ